MIQLGMDKWIEWVPEQAHGVLQQLMRSAGKHSGVLWLLTPPPYVSVALAPVNAEGVDTYIAAGGLPVGWIDKTGSVHTFHLNSPFDPPNFRVTIAEGITLDYEQFRLDKRWVAGLYENLQAQNMDIMEKAQQAKQGEHDS